MKIKLIYSYNGAKFSGSQTQPNGEAVEDSLNTALAHAGIFERVISSSRTDTGVHALGQASTTHCGDFWELGTLYNQINRHLSPYIRIKRIQKVDESFQVRFDAVARSYAYVLNHDKFSPFLSDFCHFCKKPDLGRLNQNLQIFKGKNDFSNFMKVGGSSSSPVREIYEARAYEWRNLTIIKFKANGFLRSQVRLMVANAIIATQNRQNFSLQAPLTRKPFPASALYLQRVFY